MTLKDIRSKQFKNLRIAVSRLYDLKNVFFKGQ